MMTFFLLPFVQMLFPYSTGGTESYEVRTYMIIFVLVCLCGSVSHDFLQMDVFCFRWLKCTSQALIQTTFAEWVFFWTLKYMLSLCSENPLFFCLANAPVCWRDNKEIWPPLEGLTLNWNLWLFCLSQFPHQRIPDMCLQAHLCQVRKHPTELYPLVLFLVLTFRMLDFQDAIKKVEIVKEVQTIVLNSERSVVLFFLFKETWCRKQSVSLI